MASLPAYDISLDEMSVALSYVTMALGMDMAAASPAPAAPAKKENKKGGKKAKKEAKKEEKKPKKEEEDDDDDFDVFGDDDEEEEAPKESRAEMLARLKKEAEARTAAKEAKQRTLVGVEIKPWGTEQDLMELWKKITTEIVQDGLKWGEGCTLQEVAYGIKKICTTFVMGVNNSSDDVVEAIQAMEDDVQSVEVTSMNVL
mmetsp:Transcript_50942/g.61383  ORF Transcript_50942/g.61383 Transcript_50942/m.61383 type:complete len:201 (+) Transcript_50942:138-740(+)|eukprot:CAMPEP_0172495980 /NCGR_PEP_ID=MMETSP1066-20121228/79771_1 /TAXON_ID=671091 /ORGANISM="Coscinodiscus wailesii, Strain CCMP2513" /LENGTH=200 /DNA_ID=CAMNT_0013268017 /DNA_START=137 /DNA_END=739 /DNA_ORIENTATION=+